jgi:hypothetical protein
LRYRIARLTVKAVVKPQMEKLAPATALTTFSQLLEIHDSVYKASQCDKELHELKYPTPDSHPENYSHK